VNGARRKLSKEKRLLRREAQKAASAENAIEARG